VITYRRLARPLPLLALFSCFVLLALAQREAGANSWRTFGFGPRAVAMGGAFTAVADDFSAGHYNPAGILAQPSAKFGIGYQYIRSDLKADGAEVESSRDADGIFLGGSMVVPFTDELKDRIAIGYYFFQPLFYSLDLLIPETTKPQFPLLESMARMQILMLNAAVDLIPGLLIGAGLTISSDLGGALDLEPGVAGFGGVEEVLSSVDQEVNPILSGTVGLLFRPRRFHRRLEPLTLGFTWRDEHFLDLDIPVTVVLSGFELKLDLTSVFIFTPRQWIFGISYRFSQDLLIAGELSYNEWSNYEAPTLTIATDIDIPLVELKQGVNEPPRFDDTLTPRIGLEYRAWQWQMLDGFLRAGYCFEPSPVPEQSTRTNFMDGDRHVFSWGVGVLLKNLFGMDLTRHPISLDVGTAFHWIPERDHTKVPEIRSDNPGYPDITSSGDIWYFTAGFTYGARGGYPQTAPPP
jgi:long-chain fatty acid transport protein